MPKEIERKFLVKNTSWMNRISPTYYCQGYIPTLNKATVRVRIAGDKAYLCLKSIVVNISRSEFEYPIPVEEAKEILNSLCDTPIIEKNRYKVPIGGLLWEVDIFEKENKGLIVAEVELKSESQQIDLPDWILREVTGNPRYYNSMLAKNPYSNWTQKDKEL